MTGEEQVYALLVQANPIPDPDELPLTLESTVPLLQTVDDGRGIMLTEERSQTEAPKQKRSWQHPLAVAAVAFVVVLAVGGVAWWLAGETNSPVAAADADTAVTFDGQVITYDGPDLIISGDVEFNFVNDLDETATLAAWRFEDQAALDAELAELDLGGEMALDRDSPVPADASLEVLMDAPAGAEDVALSLMPAGLYVVDVVTWESGYNDYVWRADVIVEVVP